MKVTFTYFCLAFLLLLTARSSFAQTQFWVDDFEGAAPSSGTRTPSFNGGSGGPPNTRYFKQTSLASINAPGYTGTGLQGSQCWAAEDNDGAPNGVAGTQSEIQDVTWTNISISGKTGLSFKGLFAVATTTSWDHGASTINPDFIRVEYNIDNAGWVNLLEFRPTNANLSNGNLAVDDDLDGLGEGTPLTTSFVEFSKSIAGTGTTMQLRVVVQSNALAEETAFDNIRLFETPACTAPTISGQPSTNSDVCAAGTKTISITATGATTYQWQVDASGTGTGPWTDLSNTGFYSGVTTNTLTITGANNTIHGYDYRCKAINGIASCFTTSNSTNLRVSTINLNTYAQSNVSCRNGTNGAAVIIPTGGINGTAPGAYTYSWAPSGGTSQTATGLAAGTYTVTATDATLAGCSAQRTFTITQPATSVSASSVVTNVACNGGTNGAINLTPTGGTPGYFVSWSGGVYTEDRTNITAGSYPVTVEDANGCQVSYNISVTQPAAAVSGTTVVTNVACFGGSNGAINLTPTGGTGPYTFNWGGGITTEDRTGLAAGSYSVTITDANSCTGTVNVTVTQPAAAVSGTTVVTNVACFGGSNGAINLTPTGGTGPYTFNWGGGITTEDRTGLVAGSYSVTITDANSCTGTVNVTVTQPTAAVSGSTVVTNVACNGGSNGAINLTPTGGTGPYTFNWGGGITTEDRTGLATGSYSVTITDANGCTGTVNATVTQPAAAVSGSKVVTNVSCNGGSNGAINLTPTGGTGPYTFNWGGGITTEDRTGLAAGSYSVTITDANSCTGIVNVTVTQPAAAVSGTTVVTNVACFGGSNGAINLTPTGGTGPYTFNWGGGITTEDRTGLAAGSYSVTITDANGCTGTVNATITQPSAFSVITSQTNVSCYGGSNGTATVTVSGGTGPYTYSWSPSGGTGATASGLAPGTYTVTITDDNTCQTTRSFTITEPAILTATATPTSQIICSGEQTNIALSSSPLGANFSWTVSTTSGNVSGASASSGSSIRQTLTSSGVVKYIITPDNGTCTGEPVSVSITVNPLTVIDVHPSNKSVYDEENASFSIEASHASAYQWQVDEGSGFVNISNNSHYSGATTVTLFVNDITGSMNGNSYRCVASGNCAPVASNSASLSVKVRTVQTINFATTDEKVYGSPDFVPQAGSSAGLDVMFTTSDESVASVVNGKVHIKKAGQVTITASQEGNDDYKPAVSVEQLLTIAPKEINLVFNSTPLITKAYDGNTNATLASENYSLQGMVSGDDLGATFTAKYNDKKAGTGKTITITGTELSGDDKSNYTLASAGETVSGNIAKKEITVSLISTPSIIKEYDATTPAALSSDNYELNGIVSGDEVTVTGEATYADKNAGTSKTVTVTSFVMSGADGENYTLTTTSAQTTGNIVAKEILAKVVANPAIKKVYDGTITAFPTSLNYQLTGIEEGDAVSVSGTAIYEDKTVGTGKVITVDEMSLAGTDRNNYVLANNSAVTTGSISPKVLTATLQQSQLGTQRLQGTKNPALNSVNYKLNGVIGNDDVKLSQQLTNAGTLKVSVNGLEIIGADAGNYILQVTSAVTLPAGMGTNEQSISTRLGDRVNADVPGGRYSMKVWANGRNTLQVTIYSEVTQKAVLSLYSEDGQPLMVREKQLNAGSNTFTLHVAALARGTYVVGVKSKKFTSAQKVRTN